MYLNTSHNVALLSPHNTPSKAKLTLPVHPKLRFGCLKHAGSNPHVSMMLNTKISLIMLRALALVDAMTGHTFSFTLIIF